MNITWKDYKELASEQNGTQGSFIYRGQRDSTWTLISTLMRTDLVWSRNDFQGYFNYVLPQVQEKIEAWEGRSWDLLNTLSLAEFISYLQHNGFPTPLLDWTFSPYIAAYFAFEGIDHFERKRHTKHIY